MTVDREGLVHEVQFIRGRPFDRLWANGCPLDPPTRSFFRSVGLLVLLASGLANAAAPSEYRYLALGDSFTIGTNQPESLNYPTQLAAMLRKRGDSVKLTNVAVNGYSTKEVIAEELAALEVVKPNLITLAIGANDLVREKKPEVYRARLKQIFTQLAKTKARVLVLPQPDWSQSPIAEGFGPRDALRAKIEAYNAVLAEEAKRAGATFVDCWPLMKTQGAAGLWSDDGLHPTAKAYTGWAAVLLEQLPRQGL